MTALAGKQIHWWVVSADSYYYSDLQGVSVPVIEITLEPPLQHFTHWAITISEVNGERKVVIHRITTDNHERWTVNNTEENPIAHIVQMSCMKDVPGEVWDIASGALRP